MAYVGVAWGARRPADSATRAGNSSRRFTSSRSSVTSGAPGSRLGVRPCAFRRIPAIRACAYWTQEPGGFCVRARGGGIAGDLDRLVGPAGDEVPAGGVDADRVEQLLEEDDVAPALRHLL